MLQELVGCIYPGLISFATALVKVLQFLLYKTNTLNRMILGYFRFSSNQNYVG